MNDFVMNRILLRLGKAIAALQSIELTAEQTEAMREIDKQYSAAVQWFVQSGEHH
jgi:hypothetical protein